ncbi:hypothetical protein [Sporolactobacillus pectinivorans]|uniref:hypothetical protein n=1 Tax=Sporolactobacillus pectinivorans TaxID=1591408 RepID=UPI000C263514|nr:hypothetical protein [Sporolactobacillus pectinivorans]
MVESLKKVARLEHNVLKVYGGHNELGLGPTILHEAGEAADYLINDDLVKFGTGLHCFHN